MQKELFRVVIVVALLIGILTIFHGSFNQGSTAWTQNQLARPLVRPTISPVRVAPVTIPPTLSEVTPIPAQPRQFAVVSNFHDTANGQVARDLHVVDLSSGNGRILTSGYNDYCPEVSPDGNEVVFARKHPVGTAQFDLYKINISGENLTLLDNDTELGVSESDLDESCPQWSPNGQQISFLRWGGSSTLRDLYKINRDGTGLISLSSLPGSEEEMRWAHDGSKLVFGKVVGGISGKIYSIDSDGSNATTLTSTTNYDHYPTFSPNNEYVAFVRVPHSTGLNRLIIKELATGVEYYLNTGSNFYPFSWPKWSQDGSKIIFGCSPVSGARHVCLLTINYDNIQSSEIVNITGNFWRVVNHYEWLSGNKIIVNALEEDIPGGGFSFNLFGVNLTPLNTERITNGTFRNDYLGNIGLFLQNP